MDGESGRVVLESDLFNLADIVGNPIAVLVFNHESLGSGNHAEHQ